MEALETEILAEMGIADPWPSGGPRRLTACPITDPPIFECARDGQALFRVS